MSGENNRPHIGGVWIRESKKGNKYLSVVLDFGGVFKRISLVGFKNTGKGTNDNRPDFQLYESRPPKAPSINPLKEELSPAQEEFRTDPSEEEIQDALAEWDCATSEEADSSEAEEEYYYEAVDVDPAECPLPDGMDHMEYYNYSQGEDEVIRENDQEDIFWERVKALNQAADEPVA